MMFFQTAEVSENSLDLPGVATNRGISGWPVEIPSASASARKLMG